MSPNTLLRWWYFLSRYDGITFQKRVFRKQCAHSEQYQTMVLYFGQGFVTQSIFPIAAFSPKAQLVTYQQASFKRVTFDAWHFRLVLTWPEDNRPVHVQLQFGDKAYFEQAGYREITRSRGNLRQRFTEDDMTRVIKQFNQNAFMRVVPEPSIV